jgi:hypothetical protein
MPSLRKNKKLKSQPEDAAYNWRLDAYRCYLLAYRLKALAAGFLRPTTPNELYFAEQHGAIP